MSTFGKLRKAIRKVRRPIIGITGLYVFGPRGYKAYQEWDEEQKSPSKSVLVIPFHRMQMVERKTSNFDDVNTLFSKEKNKPFQIEVRKLVEIIHKAANDPKIVALYGDFGMGQESLFSVEGFAQIEEIRNAIRVFNESHRVHAEPNSSHDPDYKTPIKRIQKQSIAYAESFDAEGANSQYLLSTQFSKIVMKDRGNLSLYGVGVSTPFLKKALQRYGIKVHVFKHGLFKNAPNTFTESSYTSEHLQNTLSMLTSIDQSLNSRIVATRNENNLFDKTMLKAIREYGTLTSKNAMEVGLIDFIAKINPLYDLIKANDDPDKMKVFEKKWDGQLDFNGFRANKEISLLDYASNSKFSVENIKERMQSASTKIQEALSDQKDNASQDTEKDKIALIYANGSIDSKMAGKIIDDLRSVEKDDAIKCVVLRVNSPGGSAMASEAIHSHCKDLSKPVICSMGNYAASGGYYIASGSERIFAMPTTITGSIGVFGVKLDLSGFFSRYGVNFGHINMGPHSNSLSLLTPLTKKIEQNINRNIDNIYNIFKEVVSEGRNMNLEEVEEISKGQIWTGDQAKNNGLVDEIGGLERAISYARTNFTRHDNAEIIEFRHQNNFFDIVSRVLTHTSVFSPKDTSAPIDPIENFFIKKFHFTGSSASMNRRGCGFMLSLNEEDAVQHMIKEIFCDDQ